ncbi:MAG: hypothetical protein ACTIJJ_07980 [Galactobacter sp.]
MHLLNAWSVTEVFMAASTDPSIPATTDDQFRDYGPGFAGFVATGAMVLVVIFLIWDMTRRIRRIRYQSEQQERQAELVAAGEEEAAQRKAAANLADDADGRSTAGDGAAGAADTTSDTDRTEPDTDEPGGRA